MFVHRNHLTGKDYDIYLRFFCSGAKVTYARSGFWGAQVVRSLADDDIYYTSLVRISISLQYAQNVA